MHDLEDRLRDALSATADSVAFIDGIEHEVIRRVRRHERRRRIAVGAAGVAVLVSVAAVIAGSQLADRPSRLATQPGTGITEPQPATAPTTAPTTATSAPSALVPPAKAAPDDIDGDGRADYVRVDWKGTGAILFAELTRVGPRTVAVPVEPYLKDEHTEQTKSLIRGLVDLDANGRREVVVLVDHGASTETMTIVQLIGDRLTLAKRNGSAVRLTVFGSIPHTWLLGCGNGEITEASWSSDNFGETYRGDRIVSRLVGGQLVERQHTTHTFVTHGQPPTDAQLRSAGYLVSCAPID
jgi:hypothetical protein